MVDGVRYSRRTYSKLEECMDTINRNGNGWKKRPLWTAFADGFQGIAQASHERIMRILWACVALAVVIGAVRGLHTLGWIFLVAYTGMLLSREHDNSVHERQEARWNRAMVQLDLQREDYNADTRYILHQATASVLILGISGLIAGILVLIYNP